MKQVFQLCDIKTGRNNNNKHVHLFFSFILDQSLYNDLITLKLFPKETCITYAQSHDFKKLNNGQKYGEQFIHKREGGLN